MRFDNYDKYSKEDLVDKINSAIAQLEHVKSWFPATVCLPQVEAMELGHAIDHAINDLQGDARSEKET